MSLVLLIANPSFGQNDSLDIRLSLDYNNLHVLEFKGPGGISLSGGINYNWLEVTLNTQYNAIFHYKRETVDGTGIMRDQFFGLGLDLNYRIFSSRRDELFVGANFYKFFLLKHLFRYESAVTGNVTEVVCKECYTNIAPYPSWDFYKDYQWKAGLQIKYYHHFNNRILLNASLEFDYLRSLEFYQPGPGYLPNRVYSLSPNIGLTYRFKLKNDD